MEVLVGYDVDVELVYTGCCCWYEVEYELES